MSDQKSGARTLLVCTNLRPFNGVPSCAGRGSKALVEFLKQEVASRNLNVEIETTICQGQCQFGPNIREPGEAFMHHADEAKIVTLLDSWSDSGQ